MKSNNGSRSDEIFDYEGLQCLYRILTHRTVDKQSFGTFVSWHKNMFSPSEDTKGLAKRKVKCSLKINVHVINI